MKLQEAIDKRHSIREFEEKPVPKEILKKLIVNAAKAPNASNRQPWKFYVISSKAKKEKIAAVLREYLAENKREIDKKQAPFNKIVNDFYIDMGGCQNVIFIYREVNKNEQVHIYPNDIASISCAVENLMLSAVEYGLGTCWIGSFKGKEKEINKILKIKNKELIASILVGYPKKGSKPLIRDKKKLNEILKFV